MDYVALLADSWKTVWKHKALLALHLGYLAVRVFGMAIAQGFVCCGWPLAYLRLSRPAASLQTP